MSAVGAASAGRVQPDGGPLRGGVSGFGIDRGVGCGRGGDLGGIDLEDAELAVVGGGAVVVAQRAFGQARAGFAGGNELARKLDQVGGQRHGRAGGLLEYGRLAEGDLFVERASFGVVAVWPGV